VVLVRTRGKLVILILATLSTSVIGAVWLTRPANSEPPLNRTLEAAMAPAINAYLDDTFDLPDWKTMPPEYKSRVLCNADFIEIRPSGSDWRVGMALNCDEFARYEGHLYENAIGYPGIADFAILSRADNGYKVLSLTVGPNSADPEWVDRNFSAAAAAVILGTDPPTAPDPIAKAWRKFGFPSGTRPISAPS
jgi:hypothetical protein